VINYTELLNESLSYRFSDCVRVIMCLVVLSNTERLRTAFFWVITQRVVVFPYWRFGTTYRSHLQVSRIWVIVWFCDFSIEWAVNSPSDFDIEKLGVLQMERLIGDFFICVFWLQRVLHHLGIPRDIYRGCYNSSHLPIYL